MTLLGVASAGYLSAAYFTISVASDGYLSRAAVIIIPPSPDDDGDGGGFFLDRRTKIVKKYGKEVEVRNEDEEIILIASQIIIRYGTCRVS